MKIGFIGTGNMGGALARAAAKGGHTLLLANRTPAKAAALADRVMDDSLMASDIVSLFIYKIANGFISIVQSISANTNICRSRLTFTPTSYPITYIMGKSHITRSYIIFLFLQIRNRKLKGRQQFRS